MLPEPVRELVQMHRYMRPAYSVAEREFCETYLDKLPGVYVDGAGNRIGSIGEAPVVLWSSHTDTVHKRAGKQRLIWGGDTLSTHQDEKGGCLGADCTVGVWLMRQMYLARVPGLYIWHAAEEIGGVGSDHIAEHTPDLLRGIQCAIALDRRGDTSVVTHQWGGRTASDAFARSLAAQLGGGYRPDPNGTFTDTANYSDVVPECTNISVGYYGQHTQDEMLDTAHAVWLLDKLLRLDVSQLVIVRAPEPSARWGNFGSYGSPRDGAHRFRPDYDETTEIADLLWECPQEVAALLVSHGYTRDSLERDIKQMAVGNPPSGLACEPADWDDDDVRRDGRGGRVVRLYGGG